jgi:four helix bundle protein
MNLIKIIITMDHYSLDELEVYKLAMEIADNIWDDVIKWHHFPKYTLGEQLTEAADSIAFNISEGYGRYSYKENIHFCYISRGSLFETRTGIKKALNRKLICKIRFDFLTDKIDELLCKLNSYINYLKRQSNNKL